MSSATHAVVITKPGHGTVRFGPLPHTTAGEWRMRLQSALVHTAHPEGTAITVEPHDPGADGACINPESIPASVDELMERFRHAAGDDSPEARFPDLYTQLVMRHGQTRGDRLWTQACDRANEEAETAQAAQDIQKDITAARAAITECLTSLMQALGSVHSAMDTADKFGIGIPDQVAAYPADATEHIAIARRSARRRAVPATRRRGLSGEDRRHRGRPRQNLARRCAVADGPAVTGQHGWPEEARIAAVKAIDRRTGTDLQVTVAVTMYLATDILDAAALLIRAAERERITGETITKDELEQAIVQLAQVTGNRDSYYPALADDIFRYAKDHRGGEA